MRTQEKPQTQKDFRLSPDGKWKSFPKTPHLLQYVSSGTYYARVKVRGKVIRESLDTPVKTTAKLMLVDFLKKHRIDSARAEFPTLEQSLVRYRQALQTDTSIKERTREYRELCILKITTSWPDLFKKRIDEVTSEQARQWAVKLKTGVASHYFNNTIATLRHIFDHGIKLHKEAGGNGVPNPIAEVPRARIQSKDLRLPEASQFADLVENIRSESGGWGRGAAELVEFLAYSGMRINSEARWVKWEDIDRKRKEIIVRGDPETRTKNNEIRRVPIIQNMAVLLERLRTPSAQPCDLILKVNECRASLTRACVELGINRLTHHDLRHLFATRCIESGVDIPTVARWLGHKDGGALAMKTYGHLRNEHSQAMAAKVKF